MSDLKSVNGVPRGVPVGHVRVTADEKSSHITDSEGRLLAVGAAQISLSHDGLQIWLMLRTAVVNISGTPKFTMVHPQTGEVRRVRSVVFETTGGGEETWQPAE